MGTKDTLVSRVTSYTESDNTTTSLTNFGSGVHNPLHAHELTQFMERFSQQLELAREDAEEDDTPIPDHNALAIARIKLESLLETSLFYPSRRSTPPPVFGTTFGVHGELELFFRDIASNRDIILWVSRDARRAKLLGIDEHLRVTRQVTEQLW